MVNQINNRDKLNLVTESEIMTLGQFAEEVWIKAHRQKKVKNKAQIKTTMKFWKEIGLWETRLDEVTTAMCFKYIQILRDRGLVPTSIQNYKTELRTLWILQLIMVKFLQMFLMALSLKEEQMMRLLKLICNSLKT